MNVAFAKKLNLSDGLHWRCWSNQNPHQVHLPLQAAVARPHQAAGEVAVAAVVVLVEAGNVTYLFIKYIRFHKSCFVKKDNPFFKLIFTYQKYFLILKHLARCLLIACLRLPIKLFAESYTYD